MADIRKRLRETATINHGHDNIRFSTIMAIKNPAGKRVYGAYFTRHALQGLIKVLDGRIELDSAVKKPNIMEMEQDPPSKI